MDELDGQVLRNQRNNRIPKNSIHIDKGLKSNKRCLLQWRVKKKKGNIVKHNATGASVDKFESATNTTNIANTTHTHQKQQKHQRHKQKTQKHQKHLEEQRKNTHTHTDTKPKRAKTKHSNKKQQETKNTKQQQ